MDFKKRTILLSVVLATVVFYGQSAFSADSQTKDFLMVDIKHSIKDGAFSVVAVDQAAATLEDVGLRQFGQYKVSIFNSALDNDIASNYFTLSQDNSSINPLDSILPEIATAPSEDNNPNIDQEIILALPLVLSAQVSDLAIKIEDTASGKILLEKPFADTTFQVRSASKFNVKMPPPPPIPIPENLFPEENIFSKYFWYIIVAIAIISIGVVIFVIWWKKKKNVPPL